ncbi:MAG TPA: hypothetical protein VK838_07190, partial [Candidatus Limnocylindrales bacterium]|nr:hypothetical protein [Candidatus Limnocylindrales bacterium]
GVIRVEERLMDGGIEQKLWAPGYGEFRTETTGEEVVVAVASPTDARRGPMPEALAALHAAAASAIESIADVARLASGWEAYRSAAPPLLAEQADSALAALESAAGADDTGGARQAALDLWLSVLDLELQYRAPAAVDLDRLAGWTRQLRLDAEAQDGEGVRSDTAIANVIWARCRSAVDPGSAQAIDSVLAELIERAAAGDLAAAAGAAERLLQAIGRAEAA